MILRSRDCGPALRDRRGSGRRSGRAWRPPAPRCGRRGPWRRPPRRARDRGRPRRPRPWRCPAARVLRPRRARRAAGRIGVELDQQRVGGVAAGQVQGRCDSRGRRARRGCGGCRGRSRRAGKVEPRQRIERASRARPLITPTAWGSASGERLPWKSGSTCRRGEGRALRARAALDAGEHDGMGVADRVSPFAVPVAGYGRAGRRRRIGRPSLSQRPGSTAPK